MYRMRKLKTSNFVQGRARLGVLVLSVVDSLLLGMIANIPCFGSFVYIGKPWLCPSAPYLRSSLK